MQIGAKLPPAFLKRLSRRIEKIFGCSCQIAEEAFKIPSGAFNPARCQYLSTALLEELRMRKPLAKHAIALGVTTVDLFVPGLNFVFGEADPVGRVAVISLCRLRQEFYGLEPDSRLFEERALKEAAHELGHVLGLGHCPNPRCVMHFSNSILDTDLKSERFCGGCSSRVRGVVPL